MPPFTDDTSVVITAPHPAATRAQELAVRHPYARKPGAHRIRTGLLTIQHP